MASRDKPGKEKRKPKKDKLGASKPRPGTDVIDHIQHHGGPSTEKSS